MASTPTSPRRRARATSTVRTARVTATPAAHAASPAAGAPRRWAIAPAASAAATSPGRRRRSIPGTSPQPGGSASAPNAGRVAATGYASGTSTSTAPTEGRTSGARGAPARDRQVGREVAAGDLARRPPQREGLGLGVGAGRRRPEVRGVVVGVQDAPEHGPERPRDDRVPDGGEDRVRRRVGLLGGEAALLEREVGDVAGREDVGRSRGRGRARRPARSPRGRWGRPAGGCRAGAAARRPRRRAAAARPRARLARRRPRPRHPAGEAHPVPLQEAPDGGARALAEGVQRRGLGRDDEHLGPPAVGPVRAAAMSASS